jgi:hypothetical protein
MRLRWHALASGGIGGGGSSSGTREPLREAAPLGALAPPIISLIDRRSKLRGDESFVSCNRMSEPVCLVG